jgi:hypothetical protein
MKRAADGYLVQGSRDRDCDLVGWLWARLWGHFWCSNNLFHFICLFPLIPYCYVGFNTILFETAYHASPLSHTLGMYHHAWCVTFAMRGASNLWVRRQSTVLLTMEKYFGGDPKVEFKTRILLSSRLSKCRTCISWMSAGNGYWCRDENNDDDVSNIIDVSYSVISMFWDLRHKKSF